MYVLWKRFNLKNMYFNDCLSSSVYSWQITHYCDFILFVGYQSSWISLYHQSTKISAPRTTRVNKRNYEEVQWNISKPNILRANSCVLNRQVIWLYIMLNKQRFSYLRTLFNVRFILDSSLFKVRLRHDFSSSSQHE